MIERAVVTDLGRLADYHAHAVVDEETPPDGRPRMDLDPGEEAGQMRDTTREPFQVRAPQGMTGMVENDRVHPWIAGQDLERVSGRGVPFEYALDVFPDTFEHGTPPRPAWAARSRSYSMSMAARASLPSLPRILPMNTEPHAPENSPLSLREALGSVLAAAVGVQSNRNRERDSRRASARQVVILGLLGTLAFVLLVYGVVRLVLSLAIG